MEQNTEPRLRPCPFCGTVPYIEVTDENFVTQFEDYEKITGRKAYYAISHLNQDVVNTVDVCPIAHDIDEVLGNLYFDSAQEAADSWNSRTMVI